MREDQLPSAFRFLKSPVTPMRSQDDQRRLDEASAVPLGFPHDFMRLPVPRNNIFGGTTVRVV